MLYLLGLDTDFLIKFCLTFESLGFHSSLFDSNFFIIVIILILLTLSANAVNYEGKCFMLNQ